MAAGLNQSANEVVQASRGTTQDLARSTSKFGQDFSNFLDAGVDMAGTSQVRRETWRHHQLVFIYMFNYSYLRLFIYISLTVYLNGIKEQCVIRIIRHKVVLLKQSMSSSSLKRTRPRWCPT